MDGKNPSRHNHKSMFCPNRDCPDYIATGKHAEYVDGVTSCPVCGEYLVETLPPKQERSREEINETEVEPIFETTDPTEVAVVKGLLKSEGIPFIASRAQRVDRFRGALPPTKFGPSASLTVFLVPTAYVEIARGLLFDFDGGEPQSP